MSIGHALALLAEEIAGTNHAFWCDDITLIDPRCFDSKRILGP